MGKSSTKDVLLNILKCLLVFYPTYYGIGSICFAIYRLENFDGKIPFDFSTWIDLSKCCVGYGGEMMVNFLSMEITCFLSGLGFGLVILHWVWDYAVTVTLIHIALSCLVMLDFPLSWSWWICLGFGLVMMISLGEAVSFARRYRSRTRTVVPDKEDKNKGSFLVNRTSR